ncbi:unnamed protein product [Chilo suppressalis]|uniref:Zinc finger PHD-type domain-containing protein n=1 Tax=Chilo suppressalis TaxID=168631 RepID=A0ABN8LCW9_CHISP|nr:unnamed protein product [Chilo suppressalis]
MAQQPTPIRQCFKCRMIIENRRFTVCSLCDNNYHINCANVSFARFRIWTNENKKSWRCNRCTVKKQSDTKSTSQYMNASNKKSIMRKTSNNTHPKRNEIINNYDLNISNEYTSPDPTEDSANTDTGRASTVLTPNSTPLKETDQQEKLITPSLCIKSLSMELLVDDENNSFQPLDELSRSMELTSDLDIVSNQKLKIEELKTQLQISETELENTILENNELRRHVERLTQEILLLKNICKTPNRNHRRHVSTSLVNTSPSPKNSKQTIILENTISKLQNDLKAAQEEVAQLHMLVARLEGNLQATKITLTKSETVKINRNVNENNNNEIKNKLCILSSEKGLKILQNVQRIDYLSQFQICHFLTTNSGINIILENIEEKLKEFTKKDFCVIMIGQRDFETAHNYKSLVKTIKTKLQQIKNTNIILTAPTYICGRPLYNHRVETFNNLLYDDININEYGCLIDSNRELTMNMFSQFSGKINHRGIQNLLQNVVKNIINQSENEDANFDVNEGDKSNKSHQKPFFLL